MQRITLELKVRKDFINVYAGNCMATALQLRKTFQEQCPQVRTLLVAVKKS